MKDWSNYYAYEQLEQEFGAVAANIMMQDASLCESFTDDPDCDIVGIVSWSETSYEQDWEKVYNG